MSLVVPFAALRAAPEHAADVVAPPYDVLSTDEVRALAAGKPWSFLHVSRPELDMAPGTDPHAPAAYAMAAYNLEKMRAHGVMLRDAKPSYYAWRMDDGAHVQTGLAFAASVAAYETHRIRRHEHTRPEKEDDRVRHIEALNAQTGPVLLAYPDAPAIDALLAQCTRSPPLEQVRSRDGVVHTLWRIDDDAALRGFGDAFEALPALYIADGHHRSAAAARVAAVRRDQPSAQRFLAVAFPQHEMRILEYNRVVRDLHGLTANEFLAAVDRTFTVTREDAAVQPEARGEFGLYLREQWYRLRLRPQAMPEDDDPVAQLDASLLTRHLLAPILGIRDLRTDKRIDFVGGARGTAELERRVADGTMAAAFSLHATRMSDLMRVADAGGVMPPKSTWFEPKLVDGLLSYVLD